MSGELSLDGTLLPVEDAGIKYQVVTEGWVNTIFLPLANKTEIIESGLHDAPSVVAADNMQELVEKIMLPLAPAHAMHRRGVNQPKHGMYMRIFGCVSSLSVYARLVCACSVCPYLSLYRPTFDTHCACIPCFSRFSSTVVPDFFLSMPKPKHDLVSIVVTDFVFPGGQVVSELQPVEVCVVFGGGRKVRLHACVCRV